MEHPLHLFTHCPRCGAPFLPHDARAKRCTACGFTYYHNAAASTVAVIVDAAQRLLVVRRRYAPAAGTLDLPGGFVEPGETLEEGCRREVREETGLDVTVERFLFSRPNTYPFSEMDIHTTDAFFLCRPHGDARPRAADDAAEARFLRRDEVVAADFGLDSVRHGVLLLLADAPLWQQTGEGDGEACLPPTEAGRCGE
jgi:ADP-ribose pyrophosphatase YjhB (NUDIX family)